MSTTPTSITRFFLHSRNHKFMLMLSHNIIDIVINTIIVIHLHRIIILNGNFINLIKLRHHNIVI